MGRASTVDRDDRVLDVPEGLQHAEQLAVPERLTPRGEPDPPGSLLHEGVRGIRLQETGLLVVAVAVDDDVGTTERAGCVDRVQRLVDPRVLARRHLVHDLLRGRGERGIPVLRCHVLGRLDGRRDDLWDPLHERLVEDPAERLDVGDAWVALEPDGVRCATPREGQCELVLPRDREVVEPGIRVPLLVGVLLEVVGLGQRSVDEDRLGRGDRRAAAPEHRDVQGVQSRCLQSDLGGDLAGRVHLGDARREEQPGRGEAGAVLLVARHEPVLLAGRVRVVHPGRERRLDDLRAVDAERTHRVADHGGALEERGEGFDGVLDGPDLVVGGLDAGDVGPHRGGELVLAAAGGDERDVVVAQVLTDQPAGVAGGAVDDDGLGAAHGFRSFGRMPGARVGCSGAVRGTYIPMPPSTGSPMPVMNRAASEARKTTASAMSSTVPSRPAGVISMTAPTAASGEGNRPSVATSLARPAPIAVGTRPGYTQLTRTPSPSLPASIAATRVSRSTADLVAE